MQEFEYLKPTHYTSCVPCYEDFDYLCGVSHSRGDYTDDVDLVDCRNCLTTLMRMGKQAEKALEEMG